MNEIALTIIVAISVLTIWWMLHKHADAEYERQKKEDENRRLWARVDEQQRELEYWRAQAQKFDGLVKPYGLPRGD